MQEAGGIWPFLVLLVGRRTWECQLRGGVVVDGGKGAEKETGEVAEDGGAAWRDEARSQQSVEAPNGIVRLCFKVTMAKHGSRVENPGAAFSTGSRKVEAAMVAGSCVNGCGLHFLSLV
jgi:hypothetical protein